MRRRACERWPRISERSAQCGQYQERMVAHAGDGERGPAGVAAGGRADAGGAWGAEGPRLVRWRGLRQVLARVSGARLAAGLVLDGAGRLGRAWRWPLARLRLADA